MVYRPITERTYLSDAPAEKRTRARQACASTRVDYAWLDVDVCLTRRGDAKPKMSPIRSSRDASHFLHEIYPVSRLTQEVFFVLCLDSKLQPVGLAIPHKGGLAGSMAEIKTIFKPAILLPAAGVIYAHNHPSGDPTPSIDDRDLTARLKEAGQILGIKFYDHMVVTGDPDRFFSFTDDASR